ncbi:T-lymphocyte activation antigen CD86 [Rhinoderma darwinii]|uniref:T-lymphocyte activation antigen CD86 n=1 Tax=Rhinoderma darwinii TaxID=43563 RepID=UPI003F680CF6
MFALLAFMAFLVPHLAAPIYQSTAYLSGKAEIKCHFQNSKNVSIKQLIFIWEKQNSKKVNSLNLVVAELFNGIRNYNHLSESYKNRSMEIMPNGDLHMFNITLEDEGVYICSVRSNVKNIEIIDQLENKLIVLANFSVPQISSGSLPEVEENSVVNLYCSSGDGFPKPHEISWMVSDQNGTLFHRNICNLESSPPCEIKNNSQTFNISSHLTAVVKSNTSITCTVYAHHTVSSEVLHIGIKKINVRIWENDNLKYILPCVILIIVTVITCIAIFCCKMKGKNSTRSLQNGIEAPTTTAPNNSDTQQLLMSPVGSPTVTDSYLCMHTHFTPPTGLLSPDLAGLPKIVLSSSIEINGEMVEHVRYRSNPMGPPV